MENKVKTEKVVTIVTGTILGEDVRLNYENLVGELPTSVQATSFIPDASGVQGAGTSIIMTAQANGQNNMNISGSWTTGNLFAVLTGMQTEAQAALAAEAAALAAAQGV